MIFSCIHTCGRDSCARHQWTHPMDGPCPKKLKIKSMRESGRFKSKLPKQGTSVHRSCPAPAGSHAGGGSYAFQCWLFLQSTVVLFFCGFCSLTPSLVMGISNGCFHAEGTFCEGNVICLRYPQGIHGKTSRGLAPACSAAWFIWTGRRTGERKSMLRQLS